MSKERGNICVNRYCPLRDKQYAVYDGYARKHGLTTKQSVSAAMKKFWKSGYIVFEESKTDRHSKIVRFTEAGREYTVWADAGNFFPGAI